MKRQQGKFNFSFYEIFFYLFRIKRQFNPQIRTKITLLTNTCTIHKCISACKLTSQCIQLFVVSIFIYLCADNIKREMKERKVYKNQMRQKSGKQQNMDEN